MVASSNIYEFQSSFPRLGQSHIFTYEINKLKQIIGGLKPLSPPPTFDGPAVDIINIFCLSLRAFPFENITKLIAEKWISKGHHLSVVVPVAITSMKEEINVYEKILK